jgi:hypothetical protein
MLNNPFIQIGLIVLFLLISLIHRFFLIEDNSDARGRRFMSCVFDMEKSVP